MFTSADLDILDAFDLPAKYFRHVGAKKSDTRFFNAGSIARKINKRERAKNIKQREKLSKAERIEFYALQVEENKPIEFQPDEDKLYAAQLKFVEGYQNINGEI